VRIGIKPGQWGWEFDELQASWRAAEEAGFDILSCFDHATSAPGGKRAWDAPSLLVAMAGVTERIALAVHVLNASLRHPFLLAAQLSVAQAASEGRVEVGLGAGSGFARLDHEVTGIPFPPFSERVSRLETCCRLLPALWRGEGVTEEAIPLKGASLGPPGFAPPRLSVGGASDAVMELAARYADAWNAGDPSPERFQALGRRLDELSRRVGRDRPIDRELQLFVREIDLSRARELCRRYEEAGANSLVFVLDEERGPDWVRRVAEAVA
jgi:alkanesulfonate monooxygenase SsuD/methylene tetrahydromethanopterin reductase-like flavin-dependent oxidoreductase (luciferase family)